MRPSRKGWLSVGTCLLVAAISSCGPSAQPRMEMTILIRMIDQQDRWFRQKMREFADENKVRLNIVTFNSIVDVQRMLALESETAGSASAAGKIGLVKTHKEMVQPLLNDGFMMPLGEIVPAERLSGDLDEYLPMALEVGRHQGRHYYVPRKLETYTQLFLDPRLEEVSRSWRRREGEIRHFFFENSEGALRLPGNYRFQGDPNLWDWYDLAVVSYLWANTEYGGRQAPRVAHRGRRYSGTMTEIATKVFQAGGGTEDLLAVMTPAVYDAFAWEAFFRKGGLYNPSMWEQRWGGGDIWKAMSNGSVFLAFMHQLDAVFIHGFTELEGYLVDPSQMRTAVMPRGASFGTERNPPGSGHYSQKSGWWWGIPRTTPDPELSYRLARHITSYEFHREEVERFGMMPVTRRVYAELDEMFSRPEQAWIRDVFQTAKHQFGLAAEGSGNENVGVRTLPVHPAWPSIQEVWLAAWYDIVAQGNYSAEGPDGAVDREFIVKRLEPYHQRIQALR